jgi:hypothetical protein
MSETSDMAAEKSWKPTTLFVPSLSSRVSSKCSDARYGV